MNIRRLYSDVMDYYRREGVSEILYRGSHRVYESIAPLEFRVKLRKNIYNIYGYDLPSDPLSPINIDPSDIKYWYEFTPKSRQPVQRESVRSSHCC